MASIAKELSYRLGYLCGQDSDWAKSVPWPTNWYKYPTEDIAWELHLSILRQEGSEGRIIAGISGLNIPSDFLLNDATTSSHGLDDTLDPGHVYACSDPLNREGNDLERLLPDYILGNPSGINGDLDVGDFDNIFTPPSDPEYVTEHSLDVRSHYETTIRGV